MMNLVNIAVMCFQIILPPASPEHMPLVKAQQSVSILLPSVPSYPYQPIFYLNTAIPQRMYVTCETDEQRYSFVSETKEPWVPVGFIFPEVLSTPESAVCTIWLEHGGYLNGMVCS